MRIRNARTAFLVPRLIHVTMTSCIQHDVSAIVDFSKETIMIIKFVILIKSRGACDIFCRGVCHLMDFTATHFGLFVKEVQYNLANSRGILGSS